MSLLRLGSLFKTSLSYASRLFVAVLLLSCFDAGAATLSAVPGEVAESPAGPQFSPVVQVTTDQADDISPALVQTADGKLLTVFERYGSLWSRASTDGGATWGAETQVADCCRNNHSLARAADGTLWLVYDLETVIEVEPGHVVVKREIRLRTSTDGGVTWSAERQLTTDSERDYDAVVFQAADGKLWIVWQSNRTSSSDLWYKTSADAGVTWSADTQLTTNTSEDYAPAITQATDGRIVVTWDREAGVLLQRSSADGGATWSVERQIAPCCRYRPSLAAVGGKLWLAYEQDQDIWYRTSADGGATWSKATAFTHFVTSDGGGTLAALAAGKMGLAWHSIRSGNQDIWFGSPGEREDTNPPPYIEWVEHQPWCNLESDDVIAFRVFAHDETGVSSVHLVWTLDGVAQDDLLMYDDGAHDDEVAGDDIWGVRVGPLPEDRQVAYQARTIDTDGNTYLHPRQNSFTVLPQFAKTAGVLFVPDNRGYNTDWFRLHYIDALDTLGYDYDIWDTERRCEPGSATLKQYAGGVVIWAAPFEGYITEEDSQRTALQSYLDAGGKLFITGQNIAQRLSWYSGANFLNDYLHATFRQEDSGLYALDGAADDAIGDGLALNISGGDGANNQYSKDEIDPIAPAEVAFTYRTGASALLAEPIRSAEAALAGPQEASRQLSPNVSSALLPEDASAAPTAALAPTALSTPAATVVSAQAPPPVPTARPTPTVPPVTPAACIGSCTAGLHVDTGDYKVVFLAFGFEAINRAADRVEVMGRALAWLEGKLPLPVLLTPALGQNVSAGDVNFTWLDVPGAAGYEIQIDTVPTFDSPDLIDAVESGTSHTHSLVTVGTHYWRVRAWFVGNWGDWTAARSFAVAAGVVQVTTDQADDTSPALVQTADGKLLTVFARNASLWSRASTDGGATWRAETRIDGCCRYNPSLARSVNGALWLAYDRDGDIWLRTSLDQGVTWSAERQLTSDPAGDPINDYDPVIFQAADNTLWVVWQSGHPFYYLSSIWYKTSADGGVTWSSDIQLTHDARDTAPAITQTAADRLVVVWNRWNWLWQSSSMDGGDTWSEPMQVSDVGRDRPGLAAVDGVLWLVYEWNGDVWHRTSMDQGETWSDEAQFTRFVGDDGAPALVALASGTAGIAWQSDRSANPDIWFGSPDERNDFNPPPYVSLVEHRPWPNPEEDDTITFRVYAMDETGVARVHLMWTLDGVVQADRPMFDDGVHDDGAAGDGMWGVQHGPLPAGHQVTYRARAADDDGNGYRYPGQNSFTVLPEFVKTAAILFVADAGGNDTPSDTTWFRPYYARALEALGRRYDTWDTELRGGPGSAILNQYTAGAVIWAVPYSGRATDSRFESVLHLQAYLDAGGKLFITGQNIADFLRNWYGEDFLKDYLHATFQQGDSGLYALVGAASDPIGSGLALNISGGDGANNQHSKDEIDPIAPAEVVFTYRAGASAMLAEPIRTVEAAPDALLDANHQPQPSVPVMPAANIGSGTAGLRVDTGAYKVVYFAFGFEAINSAADRSAVMERVLTWLGVSRPTGVYLPLAFGSRSSTLDAFWADRYRLEFGECTSIHWSVTNAQAIYLEGEGVTGQGTRLVCPAATTDYILTVVRASGTLQRILTIIVDDGAFRH